MKFFVSLAVLALCVSAFASPGEIEKADQEIMNSIFAPDLEKADSLIEAGLEKYPSHPKYHFMKSKYHFYWRYFSGVQASRDSMLNLIKQSALKAIETGENMEQTTEVKFFIGSAYGFLSRVYVMQREYWDAYWAADDCEEYLEEVLEEDPNYYDAYLHLGIIEYFPTVVNLAWYVETLVFLGGASGNREKGLEYFAKTYKNGKLFKNEAHFILGTTNRFQENDLKKAHFYFSTLAEKFPNNNFVRTQHNTTKFAKLIEDKGVDFLTAELDQLKEKYSITNSGVLNNIGYYYMGQNNRNLDYALAIFQTNIKLFPEEANPHDSLGECYINRGDNANAIKYYKMAYDKLDTDPVINDAFRERLKTGIKATLEDLGADVSS